MQCILKFMYHGEVQVAEEHLKDFLKTAETLQVKGLVEGSATPVLADEANEVTEEERLMLRRQRRLMRRRTNNDSNEDEAVDPSTTTESQKNPSSVSKNLSEAEGRAE